MILGRMILTELCGIEKLLVLISLIYLQVELVEIVRNKR